MKVRTYFSRARASTVVFVLFFAVAVKSPSENAFAANVFVSSSADITNALATAQAGDVLIMTDGNWVNQTINFAGNGNASAPITLRAQTPGGVKLSGTSSLSISGNYLVVDGLNF
jgi:Chondroitinase B